MSTSLTSLSPPSILCSSPAHILAQRRMERPKKIKEKGWRETNLNIDANALSSFVAGPLL